MTHQNKALKAANHVEVANGSRSGSVETRLGRFWTNKSKRARLLLLASLAFVMMATFGIVMFALAETEKGVSDPFNRTIGLRKIYYSVVKPAARNDIAFCACQPDRVERIVLIAGFETTVYIYDRGGPGPRPGIVLVHGNVWNGQKLSTYRVVADSLAEAGFIVLTFDKIGFGESDDPFGQGPEAVASAYDRATQVEKAVDYLIQNTEVDPERITLLGHSGGVDQVLDVGRRSDKVANIVIWIAPFDPTNEEKVETHLNYLEDKFHKSYELIYGHPVPDWFEWGLTGVVDEDPELIWDYYRQSDHKPLILILGEYDQPDAHEYELKHFDTLTGPKDIVFVSRADHYLSTAQSLRWVFYDRKIVAELIDELIASIDQAEQ